MKKQKGFTPLEVKNFLLQIKKFAGFNFVSQKIRNKLLTGFTLIELLVVVAILGLLSSIIFVVAKNSKSKAKLTSILQYEASVQHSLGAHAGGSWTFNEGSGSILRDYSGNNNNGSIAGAVWKNKGDSPNPENYSLYFDGNDYVAIPASESLNLSGDNETVLIWVKHNSNFVMGNSWNRRLFSTNWIMIDKSSNYYYPSTLGSNDNQWHLVGYTISGKIIKSYVDGKLISNITAMDVVPKSNTAWQLGGKICSGAGCENYYTGQIGGLKIYKEALTLLEINKIYAQESLIYKSLAAYK